MARKRYRQSRRNAVIQWGLPIVVMVVAVLVQTRLEREIGWLLLLIVLGFMVWFGILYERSRDDETSLETPGSEQIDKEEELEAANAAPRGPGGST